MHARYPLLFAPARINQVELANRIVLTAMVTRLSGEDGFVNRDVRDRYLRFARGEPGLIVLEAMSVHGGKSGPLLRISDDAYLPGLRDLARAMHDVSPSKVVPQIIHFLKIARSGWREQVADLTRAAIKEIVVQYGAAGSVRAAPASTASSCTWRTPTRSPRSCRVATIARTSTAARSRTACG
ncbi:MAG: hypothetical protein U1E76_02795 [Planctomycetota bacterium]